MLSAFVLGIAIGGLWIRRRIDAARESMHWMTVTRPLHPLAVAARHAELAHPRQDALRVDLAQVTAHEPVLAVEAVPELGHEEPRVAVEVVEVFAADREDAVRRRAFNRAFRRAHATTPGAYARRDAAGLPLTDGSADVALLLSR